MAKTSISRATYAEVRAALLERREIALIDVREEDTHARAHPLFAAHLPLSRLELEVFARLPRPDAAIVVLDEDGGPAGYAERAARRLAVLGYARVSLFEGGIAGWRAAGGELFRDVNVPSKAFGELVDAVLRPPSLAADELKSLLDANADMIVADVRRFNEYQTMSIPGAINVPGAELALRLPGLAPDPATRVIVNCAGRTRGIIGAQSLINAGLPNPVAVLRNGTIGWTLAGLGGHLEHGQTRRFTAVSEAARQRAAARARFLAQSAGAGQVTLSGIAPWQAQKERTTYFIDVRDPAEYESGHLPGFRNVPGGQLVQETEMTATVRGARLVLADDDGVRANMTASWLAQMAWEVYVLAPPASGWTETGPWRPPLPPPPDAPAIAPETLRDWRRSSEPPVLIDLALYADYRRGHIPGAWYVPRAELAAGALAKLPRASRYVLVCASGALARHAHAETAAAARRHGGEVFVLAGGADAWKAARLPLEQTEHLASEPLDRYRRPYEGTDNSAAAMQAYLDWEYSLVEQLERDGTHHFQVKKFTT